MQIDIIQTDNVLCQIIIQKCYRLHPNNFCTNNLCNQNIVDINTCCPQIGAINTYTSKP